MLRRLLRKAARRLEDALAVDPPRATKTATHGSPADRDESLAATVERARARMREEEPAAVLVYATAKDRAAVDTIRDVFAKYGETIREVDLDRDPRHFRNIAASTGVMVPPYVFVHGRHIGSDQEVAALDAENELAKILAGRLDELGPEARRMLRLRESFSDEVSLENLRDRLAPEGTACRWTASIRGSSRARTGRCSSTWDAPTAATTSNGSWRASSRTPPPNGSRCASTWTRTCASAGRSRPARGGLPPLHGRRRHGRADDATQGHVHAPACLVREDGADLRLQRGLVLGEPLAHALGREQVAP